jgi:hypothetical protein
MAQAGRPLLVLLLMLLDQKLLLLKCHPHHLHKVFTQVCLQQAVEQLRAGSRTAGDSRSQLHPS